MSAQIFEKVFNFQNLRALSNCLYSPNFEILCLAVECRSLKNNFLKNQIHTYEQSEIHIRIIRSLLNNAPKICQKCQGVELAIFSRFQNLFDLKFRWHLERLWFRQKVLQGHCC